MLKDTFTIQPQPTETSCGPTCLHAIYNYWGLNSSLNELVDSVPRSRSGGTFSVLLGIHAIDQGLEATIYSYNVKVFDPTWRDLSMKKLLQKVRARAKVVKSKQASSNLKAYIEFLQKGGKVRFDELKPKLIKEILRQEQPIIAGLNSNHLYRYSRTDEQGRDDDIAGQPEGHFVVLTGFEDKPTRFLVCDPYAKSPLSNKLKYWVGPHRLINSIMLGIITYDANLLVIKPRS